jgi:hypothetical protein
LFVKNKGSNTVRKENEHMHGKYVENAQYLQNVKSLWRWSNEQNKKFSG